MSDPIRDELHRLNKEFGKLLDITDNTCYIKKTTPEELVQRFGLTADEAKAWLENEPNYIPSDEFSHKKPSDDNYTEPMRAQPL